MLGRFIIVILLAIAVVAGLLLLIKTLQVTEDAESHTAAEMKDRLDQLRSVPYTSRTAPSADSLVAGVVLNLAGRTWPGYNLYCSRTTPYAHLMDMEGRIVHSWTYSPDGEPGEVDVPADSSDEDPIWEHAIMLENGDLVAIRKMASLIRLDWDSNLLWEIPLEVHHEVTPLPDGTFYTIAREVEKHRGLEIRFPSIMLLSADGERLKRWSTYEHLDEIKRGFDQRSFLDTVLDGLLADGDSAAVYENIQKQPGMFRLKGNRQYFDYLHLNTITRLPETSLGERDPRFREGNLLICFRNINQIGVLDQDGMDILWAWGEGELQWPHHPTMLENGNILVFDNGVQRRSSRVVEIEPLSGRIVWEYRADPPSSFYTSQRGSAQRLPNGNTLICDGNGGRAFEVDAGGETVWEWFNPDIERGRREQIYRIARLPTDLVDPLLDDRVE
jgi:hypothetical protein